MTNNKIPIGAVAVAILLTLVVIYQIPKEHLTMLNLIGVIGTIASVFGLFLAYLQILSIKETTNKTRRAVDESITRVNEILSISELSKGIKNIELVQNSIKNKKFALAEILMKDLKGLLIQLNHIQGFEAETATIEYKGLLMNLAVDLNNLRQLEQEEGIEIDHYKMMSNLDEVSSVLIALENKLKFKNHDVAAN